MDFTSVVLMFSLKTITFPMAMTVSQVLLVLIETNIASLANYFILV
jgi:hypothetical protein